MAIQPQDMVWVSIGTFVALAQPFIIILYPFWKLLIFRKSIVITVSLAIIMFFTAVFYLLPPEILSFSFLQLWRTTMIAPGMVFCAIFLAKDRAKVMYFALIITTFLVAIIKLANHVVWAYFDGANYTDLTVVHIIAHALTTPLFMVFINRLVKRTVPVVEPSGKRIWKIVWIIPTIFLAINLAFNLRFNPEIIVTQAFVLSNILSIVGVLVSSEVLLRAIQITAEAETAKREAEEARLKERELAAENAALENLNRMKTEFLQDISHEIKTPLTVISGYVQQAAEELEDLGIENKYINPALAKAHEESLRLGRLTENALKMAIMQENRGKMKTLDPAELFTVNAEGYRSYIKKRGNTLTINAAKDLPLIFGNADRLIQVLTNLLGNANKHTRNGDISVIVELNKEELQKGDEMDNDCITVTVADTGTGIDPELLPDVFRRGVTSGAGASGSDGTGMGLAICKNITEAHGGTIDIVSEPGKGTAVTFTLPIYDEGKVDNND